MAAPTEADAEAVYLIDINDMKSVFQFQTDSSGVNLLDVTSSNTSLRYYVDHSHWPSFNAANGMMDHLASVDPIASGYQTDKMMITHDFMRHLAKGVFNTHHGVDLFNNEKDMLTNIRSICGDGDGNTMGEINEALELVSLTGTHSSSKTDASNNKYMDNTFMGNENICRRLYQRLASSVSSRWSRYSWTDSTSPYLSKQPLPFDVDDIISFHLTLNAKSDQHNLTSTNTVQPRIYKIKLLLKETANVSNTTVDANET